MLNNKYITLARVADHKRVFKCLKIKAILSFFFRKYEVLVCLTLAMGKLFLKVVVEVRFLKN